MGKDLFTIMPRLTRYIRFMHIDWVILAALQGLKRSELLLKGQTSQQEKNSFPCYSDCLSPIIPLSRRFSLLEIA